MNNFKLEIACFNLGSALAAELAGADRIELCTKRDFGGITPDKEIIWWARKKILIDLYVMIRPRKGNFFYSEPEFEEMKTNILECKKAGVNGVVFGILNAVHLVDMKRNIELVKLAKPMHCTFHRAFDTVNEPLYALENIIACGFQTILTSGQKQSAIEGVDLLAELVKCAEGRISIMPGGGVRSTNILSLVEKVNAGYYHSSAITGKNESADMDEIKRIKEKLLQ